MHDDQSSEPEWTQTGQLGEGFTDLRRRLRIVPMTRMPSSFEEPGHGDLRWTFTEDLCN